MTTTALLVDILIVGIQVLLWISGFVFSLVFPPDIVVRFAELNSTLLISSIVFLSYSLGIIFDYIIAKFFTNFKSKEQVEAYRSGLVIDILFHDKEVQKFLDNQYQRLRIARATVFNLPMLTISWCSFILTNDVTGKFGTCATTFIVLAFGSFMTILALLGWKARDKTYWGYIKETLPHLDKHQNGT